ncbi:hypothetical protein P7C70_g5201, partial [Phenoliferia sp. Uapishka_3]
MLSFTALVISFIIGGFTLVPLLLAIFLAFIFYTSPVVNLPRKTGIPTPGSTPADEEEVVKLYRAGWLTVRRTYEPLVGSGDATYVAALVSGYRSFMDNRSRDPRKIKPKDKFYCVLKQNILFLYDNEEQVDCWAAIEVTAHDALIYPEGCLDGELFVKRNAVCLRPLQSRLPYDSALSSHSASEETTHDIDADKPLPWFIFAKVNTDKEDWYHSLVEASKLAGPNSTANLAKDRSMFDPDDMARLVEGIDQQPDSIPMRWLNALFGRIFLAVYRTESLEAYITSRIVRKLKRVKTPSILSEVQVREVNVGSSAPFFSKPMLKELTADGDASMEVHLSYVGDLRITIETVATINLGSRFKPYSVRLVLAVVLKEIEGTLLFKIKKPPSNRVWFGFSTMPRIVLSVEPVVSTRQISWSMITSPIESRIREVILESIVVPHMDDFPFFNSSSLFHRGGIWGDALRKEHDLHTPAGGPGDEGHTIGQDEAIDDESLATPAGVEPTGVTTGREEGGEPRLRLRKRRSSDGDAPLSALAVEATNMAKEAREAKEAKNAPPTSSSASSLSGFSLSSWRDSSTKPKDGATKRTSWFAPRSASATPTNTTPPASLPSLSRTSTNASSTTTASNVEEPESKEISATRLKDILTKRAQDREKEKETARASLVEGNRETNGTRPPLLSGLSLTAPSSESEKREAPTTPDGVRRGAVPSSGRSRSASSVPDVTLEAPSPTSSVPPQFPSISMSTSVSSLDLNAPTSSSSSAPTIPNSRSFATNLSASPPTTLAAPLLPPRRPSHSGSVSVDSGTPSTSATSSTSPQTTSSILASWRTKAADKQALAAGVAQAKDTMKRWGANWNARRAALAAESASEEDEGREGEANSSPPQDGGNSFGGNKTRDPSPGAGEYRDYRAGKGKARNGNGSYFGAANEGTASDVGVVGGSTMTTASMPISSEETTPRRKPDTVRGDASRRRASGSLSSSPISGGLFTPAASQPTTKLSTAPTFGSPTNVAAAPPTPIKDARSYKKAPTMAVPGIRDQSRRQAVAEDHVSADQVGQSADNGNGEEIARKSEPPKIPTKPSARAVEKEDIEPVEEKPFESAVEKKEVSERVVPDDPAVILTPALTPSAGASTSTAVEDTTATPSPFFASTSTSIEPAETSTTPLVVPMALPPLIPSSPRPPPSPKVLSESPAILDEQHTPSTRRPVPPPPPPRPVPSIASSSSSVDRVPTPPRRPVPPLPVAASPTPVEVEIVRSEGKGKGKEVEDSADEAGWGIGDVDGLEGLEGES